MFLAGFDCNTLIACPLAHNDVGSGIALLSCPSCPDSNQLKFVKGRGLIEIFAAGIEARHPSSVIDPQWLCPMVRSTVTTKIF